MKRNINAERTDSHMEGAGGMLDSIEFARFDHLVKGVSLFDVFYDSVGELVRILEALKIFAFRVRSSYMADEARDVSKLVIRIGVFRALPNDGWTTRNNVR